MVVQGLALGICPSLVQGVNVRWVRRLSRVGRASRYVGDMTIDPTGGEKSENQ
jgi:hypothetical protein